MKSSTRLDSAVFQLTPTRTRCDLVIFANGKTEKIASGLLSPFLAHLKTAQDEMAKGGYSIILELEPGNEATWFTKGTVERFVRFVSTPEVLERVYTIESEILQIEEAIAIQSNHEIGITAVDNHQAKPVESVEGSKALLDPNEEKAIVIYKPDSHAPEANGSTAPEEDSKVQLLRVLETRKTVLQKEQGMAFARAAAAGFDIDHMTPLMSFAESFGASRLMDACLRFKDLWRKKHETGQWLEIEAAEAISTREMWPESSQNNGKPSVDTSSDEKPTMDHRSIGGQEYSQGQFPQPIFPPWPIHSPPGALPVFQGYAVQGMPYYPNYPGNGPFFQSPYTAGENPASAGQRLRQKRQSMDNKDSESENWEMEKSRSQEDMEVDMEASQSQERRKKSSRSGKKQSGMVVIRNINYVTSKKSMSSGSESQSASGSASDEDDGDDNDLGTSQKMKYKKSLRYLKGKESTKESMDLRSSFDKEGTSEGTEMNGGHWQAFQSYLLRDADKEESAGSQGMFAMEEEIRAKRRQNGVGDDPLAYDGRDMNQYQEGTNSDVQHISGSMTRMLKNSNDESLISRTVSGDSRAFVDVRSTEIDGRRVAYRRSGTDDFVLHRRENQSGHPNPQGPLPMNGFEYANSGLDKRLPQNMDDDSYIISLRSVSLEEVGTNDRNAVDMDSEFPSRQKDENISNRVKSQLKYEPDDLSLMPERGTEKRSIGYDPALDFEMQAHASDGASLSKKNKEMVTDIRRGSKKSDASDKKKVVGPIRKVRPSKSSPLDEAKARAERLRNFKADLQKMKKEKENEEIRRIEALKAARQKRIAARGSSITAQSPLPSQQLRKQVVAKVSPSFNKGSKFSDTEPQSSSSLRRFPIRNASLWSSDSQKPSKPGKLNTGSHSAGNRLSRSVSSLSERRKESSEMSDKKTSISRIRRLSEPKMTSSTQVAVVKARSTGPKSKPKKTDEPESKKISAIVNHDKSKGASLPELKIKTLKSPVIASEKLTAKEIVQKVNGSESSAPEIKPKKDKDMFYDNVCDDNTVVEKTVVMLEREKIIIPTLQASAENIGREKEHYDNHKIGEKSKMVSDYPNIHASVSPQNMEVADKELTKPSLQRQQNAYDRALVATGNLGNMEKESPNVSRNVDEKPYQAPYARVSSLEESCTRNSEYGRAPPASTQTDTVDIGPSALLSDSKSSKLDKIPETLLKPQIKDSSKGLRRLLKFGRKSNSSATGERSVESDNTSLDGSEADELVVTTAASSEVNTLKNLISQDEAPATATPQKTSRNFSLLSPFRSKNGEKKLAT